MRKMIFPLITEEESRLPFYLTSIGSLENQHDVNRPDGYNSYHWLHCTSGSGRLSAAGRDYAVEGGTGFLLFPGVPHEYHAVTEPWTTFWITFDGRSVPELMSVLGIGSFEIYQITDMIRLDALHDDIHSAASSERRLRGLESSHRLYRFLLELKGCTSPWESRSRHQRFGQLQRILDHIESNFSRNISLAEMAGAAGVTPQHVCRLFRQAYGMRPFEYLNRLRLQRAKEMLVSPSDPLLRDVAASVGYNDTSYFCAVFREYEGLTPIEFKRLHADCRAYSAAGIFKT
jgi:AraC family transcriptional regulator of arabinose operon